MKRKEFIKQFAVGGSILFTAPVLLNSCSEDGEIPEEENGGNNNPNEIIIDLTHDDFKDLGNVGGFAYHADIIIFRTSETGYGALSKVCTHNQCTISYNHTNGDLPCPCHGSKFNTTGSVITGPAESSLKKYNVVKDGDSLKLS